MGIGKQVKEEEKKKTIEKNKFARAKLKVFSPILKKRRDWSYTHEHKTQSLVAYLISQKDYLTWCEFVEENNLQLHTGIPILLYLNGLSSLLALECDVYHFVIFIRLKKYVIL